MIHVIPNLESAEVGGERISGEGKLLIAMILRALQDLSLPQSYTEFGRKVEYSQSAWEFLNSKHCVHICALLDINHDALIDRATDILEQSTSFDADGYRRLKISELRRGK